MPRWTPADLVDHCPERVLPRSALLQSGATHDDVVRAVERGGLVRLRWGWYALPDAPAHVVRAVGSGGVLSCLSALAAAGVWVPPIDQVHTRRSQHLRRRAPRDVKVCKPTGRPGPTTLAVDPIPVALASAAHCCSGEEFVSVMDSVLHLGRLSLRGVELALAAEPSFIRALPDRCAPAESGTESLVRLRLRARGHRVRSQVWINGVGRVDLVVGDRLIIEVDSRAHHTLERNYRADRARDRRALARGFICVRVTWEEVMFHWETVLQDVEHLLDRGVHHKGC